MRLIEATQLTAVFCCALIAGNINTPVDLLLLAALALAAVAAAGTAVSLRRVLSAAPGNLFTHTTYRPVNFPAPDDPDVPGNPRPRAPGLSFAPA